MIEELELIKPELKARVENERRVSRSRIISLERELEGQQDYYRASEVARDRQLKSLQRDIEGLFPYWFMMISDIMDSSLTSDFKAVYRLFPGGPQSDIQLLRNRVR